MLLVLGQPDFEKVLREVGDIEVDEEFDVEEIKGSITRRNRVFYQVKWLGYPRKNDWAFEGGREKLLEYHARNPSKPRDYRLVSNAELVANGPLAEGSNCRCVASGGCV